MSVGTASKALNNQGSLRDETRVHVQNVARQLGFRPNDLVLSLRRQRSFTIGLISTDRYGRFSIPLLEGIEAALNAARMSVFLCNAADDAQLEQQHIDALLAKRVDGIIVTSRRTDPRAPINLGGSQVPLLYAYAQVEDPDALCLLPDDYGGAWQATEHLAALGRQHIAHISGPDRFQAAQARRAAWQDTLDRCGLTVTDALHGAWSEAWGAAAVNELLARHPETDAIFCGSDQIARGVADALRERGIRVPADIALVGYDNWEIIAAATRPALSSVDMNLHELGRLAGSKLLDLIDGHQETGLLRLPTGWSFGTPAALRASVHHPARSWPRLFAPWAVRSGLSTALFMISVRPEEEERPTTEQRPPPRSPLAYHSSGTP